MTIVATWYDRQNNRIRCLADSRLSTKGVERSTGKVTSKKLIDHAPKLLQIPLTTFVSEGEERWRPATQTSFGFAYAGSSLAAMTTYSLACACTQNLAADSGAPPPSLEELVVLIVNIANRCLTDFVIENPESLFEAHVFGFCPMHQRLEAYGVAESGDADHMFGVDSLSLGPGVVELLGMKGPQFKPLLDAANGNIFRALYDLIESDTNPGIGGHLQYAEATRDGTFLRPMLETRAGVASFCGLEVSMSHPFRNHNIGTYAVHPHMQAHPELYPEEPG